MKMNKSSALKEAQRRWGAEAIVRDNGASRAGTPESRGEALEELKRLRETVNQQKALRTREQREEMDMLFSLAMAYRYDVGQRVHGMWFRVEGYGDTWEKAFALVDAKEARAKVNGTGKKRSAKRASAK